MLQEQIIPLEVSTFGRYRLFERLGVGGMASVYRARMQGMGGFSKTVALKLFHEALAQHPDFSKLFIGEARLGGYLSHPNIVEITDFGEAHGRLFLAMEYVNGPTLEKAFALHRYLGRPIPPAIALQLLVQVCAGLEHAHRATDHDGQPLRIVHRDIKPSNILLGRHGHVKLADFGVARAESNLFHTQYSGEIKGTIRYMSPEQALGLRDIDLRSDLFALCIVLFEALTLTHLYEADNWQMLLRAVQDANVAPCLERLPGGPARERLLEVLRRGLAADRDARFQSAAELAATLEELLPMMPPAPRLGSWLEQTCQALETAAPRNGHPRAPVRAATALGPAGAGSSPGGAREGESRGLEPIPLRGLEPIPLRPRRVALQAGEDGASSWAPDPGGTFVMPESQEEGWLPPDLLLEEGWSPPQQVLEGASPVTGYPYGGGSERPVGGSGAGPGSRLETSGRQLQLDSSRGRSGGGGAPLHEPEAGEAGWSDAGEDDTDAIAVEEAPPRQGGGGGSFLGRMALGVLLSLLAASSVLLVPPQRPSSIITSEAPLLPGRPGQEATGSTGAMGLASAGALEATPGPRLEEGGGRAGAVVAAPVGAASIDTAVPGDDSAIDAGAREGDREASPAAGREVTPAGKQEARSGRASRRSADPAAGPAGAEPSRPEGPQPSGSEPADPRVAMGSPQGPATSPALTIEAPRRALRNTRLLVTIDAASSGCATTVHWKVRGESDWHLEPLRGPGPTWFWVLEVTAAHRPGLLYFVTTQGCGEIASAEMPRELLVL